MPLKYKVAKDGEWINPKMTGYRIACCDCGLVHILNFRIAKGGKSIRIQPIRDMEETKKVRKKNKNLQITNAHPHQI